MYGLGLLSSILIPPASSQHNLYDIYLLLCVQCWNPDDGQRYCPKHVKFYSKNKFEKLFHLVGFIIRIVPNNSRVPALYANRRLTGVDMCSCTSPPQYVRVHKDVQLILIH